MLFRSDPPYISHKASGQYSDVPIFSDKDYMWILEFLKDKKTKCKVMLNTDYFAWMRENYAKYYKTCYPKKYNMRNKSGHKELFTPYQIIFTNY